MTQTSAQTIAQNRTLSIWRDVLLVAGASLLMATLARFSMPLPFTPVLLSLSNLGVLFIGLTLGSRRAAAALLLYLAEGAMGLPVFSAGGAGGIAQIMGATGGFLMAYPVAAFAGGSIAERGARTLLRSTVAAVLAEIVVFAGGVSWLMYLTRVPLAQAIDWGVYPFAFFEVIKILLAVGGSLRLHRSPKLAGMIG
jgi:biotin transport system substrate-specific component